MPTNSSVELSIIKDILEKLKGVRVKEFVVDSPKDLKEFGLDKPGYTIKIWQEGSNTPQELNIGKTDNNGRAVYALMEGNSVISLGMEITELFKTL